jgi:uncharacterized protein YlaI
MVVYYSALIECVQCNNKWELNSREIDKLNQNRPAFKCPECETQILKVKDVAHNTFNLFKQSGDWETIDFSKEQNRRQGVIEKNNLKGDLYYVCYE